VKGKKQLSERKETVEERRDVEVAGRVVDLFDGVHRHRKMRRRRERII
jgi:hypothetical protein